MKKQSNRFCPASSIKVVQDVFRHDESYENGMFTARFQLLYRPEAKCSLGQSAVSLNKTVSTLHAAHTAFFKIYCGSVFSPTADWNESKQNS